MLENIKLQLSKLNKRNVLFIVLGLILVFTIIRVAASPKNKKQNSNPATTASVATVTDFADINKSFQFNAIDANKKTVPVTFTIVSAERKNDISVKGEDRKPNAGKDYLLMRIEIQNQKTQRVAIATADRIRLEGDSGKLYAPDYHNGNVVIDPLSTKKDIVAFSVDSKQKHFVFDVGELDGEKQKIEVNF